MKLRDLLKENDNYQLVLAQSANLEIPEDFEQLETREYKDMLNKLHDSYGEDKYTKEPAHFLSTAIDYILDDPREDDLKTAHEFLHKHKNAAAKELSDKNNNMKLRDLLNENNSYQSALTQVANLETNVSKMIEKEGKVNTLRMLLNLHDSFGEGKYNRPKGYKAELPYISTSEFSIAGILKLVIDFIMYPSIDGRDSDMFEAEQFLKSAKKRAVEELSDETNSIYPGYTSTVTENKDILPKAGTKPEKLYSKAMTATKSLTREMTGLFLPGTIDNLTADEIMSMIKQVDSLKSKIKNLAESK